MKLSRAIEQGYINPTKIDLPYELLNIKDEHGNSILYYALVYDNIEDAKTLIDMGADPNISANEMIELVAQRQHNAIEFILPYYVIDQQDTRGDTLLHYLTAWDNPINLLKLTLEKNPNLNIQNNIGDTPINLATQKGMLSDQMKLVLEAGADVNLPNNKGETPLYNLLLDNLNAYNHTELSKNPDFIKYLIEDIQFLLNYNANTYIKTNDGVTIDDAINNIQYENVRESVRKVIEQARRRGNIKSARIGRKGTMKNNNINPLINHNLYDLLSLAKMYNVKTINDLADYLNL